MKKRTTSLENFCSACVAIFMLVPSLIYMIMEEGFPWKFYLTVFIGCVIYLIVYHLRGGNQFDELTRMIDSTSDPDKISFYKGCREVNRDSVMGVELVTIIGFGAISIVMQWVDFLIPSLLCGLVIGFCFMALIRSLTQKIPEEKTPTVEDIVAEMNEEFKANAARVRGI